MPLSSLHHQDLHITDTHGGSTRSITGSLDEKCSVARVRHPCFAYNVNLRRGRDVVTFWGETVVPVSLCR